MVSLKHPWTATRPINRHFPKRLGPLSGVLGLSWGTRYINVQYAMMIYFIFIYGPPAFSRFHCFVLESWR